MKEHEDNKLSLDYLQNEEHSSTVHDTQQVHSVLQVTPEDNHVQHAIDLQNNINNEGLYDDLNSPLSGELNSNIFSCCIIL